MSDETKREVGVRQGALRDASDAEVVERVWRRLDGNLDSSRRTGLRQPAFTWAILASAATFALGVAVGRGGLSVASETANLALEAEPRMEFPPNQSGEATQLPQRGEETALPSRPTPDRAARPSRRNRAGEHHPAWAHRPPGAQDPSSIGEQPAPVEQAATPEPAETSSEAVAPPSWQRLANAGEYEAALFELGQQGGFEAALLSANAEQLMLLADVARATGQTQRALAAFRRVVSEFRNEPVAPLAAYSLGSLLQKAGDASGAAQAFAVYRALSPEGDFAEDALVRQLRSAVERDDREYAEQLAAQYRVDFPEGRRGEEVDHWLDELLAREQARVHQDAGAEEPHPLVPSDEATTGESEPAPVQSSEAPVPPGDTDARPQP